MVRRGSASVASGALVSEGDPAPAFTLQATDGQRVSLSAYRGTSVILYFYPRDNTPGCTREACGFRDTLSRFTKANAVILGVSRDSVDSHQRYTEKFTLPFPLLSDPDAAVCKAYGVYKQKSLYGTTSWGIERTTFIINANGRIAAVFPRVKVDGHVDTVLESLQHAS